MLLIHKPMFISNIHRGKPNSSVTTELSSFTHSLNRYGLKDSEYNAECLPTNHKALGSIPITKNKQINKNTY
jgi:hypothetical protein